MALKISVYALDRDTIHQILSFCKNNLLILTIEATDLDMLILSESFSTLQAMVDASVQLERSVIKSEGESKKKKTDGKKEEQKSRVPAK